VRNTPLQTFQYDATGRRTRKTINGVTTDFVHDGITPVTESGPSGTSFLLTGLGVDDFLLRLGSGGTSMFLTDALGSLVATTDAAGGVQSELTYEPFGNTEMSSPAPAYRFTGREHDEPLYLYYYRARYYHTDLQRFISEDPIGFGGGDPNLYAYVHNSPTRFIDPLGLHTLDYTQPTYCMELGGRKGECKPPDSDPPPLLACAAGCVGDITIVIGGVIVLKAYQDWYFERGIFAKAQPGTLGRPGTFPNIIELPGGQGGADDVFDELSKGGKPTNNPRYPGRQVRMPDGTVVGSRPGNDGTPTIDLNIPGQPNIKLKFPPGYK
jgi:RHS repeat-associated protein